MTAAPQTLRFSIRLFKRIWHARVPGLKTIPHFIFKLVLTLFGWLVRVEGVQELRAARPPVIFALNHNNYMETLFIPCYLMFLTGRKVSFLVHWMWKDFPFVGWLIRFIDPVWVWSKTTRLFSRRRTPPAGAAFAVTAAVRRFQSGIDLGIFPEGKRNHDPGTLLKSRRGLGEIALRCRAPIVPIGIDFPRRMRRGRIPALGRMILRIGPPLFPEREFEDAAGIIWKDNEPADRRAFRGLALKINARVMGEIGKLCGKRSREAPPPAALPVGK